MGDGRSMADLRSDTVTRPSAAMREVMKNAEVGDDVLGDDETVIQLQELGAKMLGKESALFVPSGTMSNAVAIRCHTQPGDELVTESKSHIYNYEGGGYAALSGCSIRLVQGENGMMTAQQVHSAIRKAAGSQSHFADGSLVCMENTANGGGGVCWEQSEIDAVSETSHDKECAVHMDGARLFNAVVHTGVSADRMVANCDTISICLSKGLGAPIGSLLVGDEEVIENAHRWRKMFGGGMRQAGIIASAGIYSLQNNVVRLGEDHARIRRLAEAISVLDSFSIDMETVQTNMVYIGVDEEKFSADDVVSKLANKGIDLLSTGPQDIRAVAHLDVDDKDIEQAISVFQSLSH
ncbi:MAG: threonine aldolase family protein [Candidatus Poseidoniales archaeon]|tara:strand:- start:837 stop:1889 length:1053 start_codon:yes stop_codon:yes gene_type:complete